MDAKGYEIITQAFIDEHVSAVVLPYPAEGEHSEHVSVTFDNEITPPSLVLNALGKAGLYTSRGNGEKPEHGPYLELLFGDSSSITFVDANHHH